MIAFGVPKKCFHREKVVSDVYTKDFRLLKPVSLEKEVEFKPEKKHKNIHETIQPTSSCNFGSMSALNQVKLFVRKKSRDMGMSKRF